MKEVEFFEQMALKRLDRHKQKIKNPGLSLMLYANTNSKWIIYLNVKPFRGKKNRRTTSLGSRTRQNIFKHQKYAPENEKINKLDYINTKNFDLEKTPLKGWKDKLRFGRKYL